MISLSLVVIKKFKYKKTVEIIFTVCGEESAAIAEAEKRMWDEISEYCGVNDICVSNDEIHQATQDQNYVLDLKDGRTYTAILLEPKEIICLN